MLLEVDRDWYWALVCQACRASAVDIATRFDETRGALAQAARRQATAASTSSLLAVVPYAAIGHRSV